MKFSLAEFFCGCGGFSRGFTRSGHFNALLGNDVKAEALRTFQFNHRLDDVPPKTILKDIRLLRLDEIKQALADRGIDSGNLDCLIGGPPCQGFSQLRRSEERENGKIVKFRGYSQLAHDPRNSLVLRFLEIAEALSPKFIVIENVPQMLNHGYRGRLGKLAETVVEILERELGYSVAVSVINAADYGVAQLRERAIFIASAVGSATFPAASHVNPEKKLLVTAGRRPWVSVEDAIGDLPEPVLGEDSLGGGPTSLYRGETSSYSNALRSQEAFPFNHVTRKYGDSVLRIIREMRPGEVWDAAMQRMTAKYERLIGRHARAKHVSLRAAKQELIASGTINPVFYKRYYWSAYTRLAWDAPALTITANANFPGSGRFTHPVAMRGITMREAARLQSFDDDFRFVTSSTDDADTVRMGIGLDMIGEAVPPLLACAIAEQIAGQLARRHAREGIAA